MPRKNPPPRVRDLRAVAERATQSADQACTQRLGRQLSLIDPGDIVVDSGGADSWCTPPEIYEPILAFLGAKVFGLDPCSNEHSTIPSRKAYTAAHDGLSQDWSKAKSIWLNPPYSKPGPWIEELEAATQAERFALVKCDPTTRSFQPLWRSSAILFLRRRVKFLHCGQRQTSATFPCVLAYWGKSPEAYAVTMAPLGVVVAPELAATRGTIFRQCVLKN